MKVLNSIDWVLQLADNHASGSICAYYFKFCGPENAKLKTESQALISLSAFAVVIPPVYPGHRKQAVRFSSNEICINSFLIAFWLLDFFWYADAPPTLRSRPNCKPPVCVFLSGRAHLQCPNKSETSIPRCNDTRINIGAELFAGTIFAEPKRDVVAEIQVRQVLI